MYLSVWAWSFFNILLKMKAMISEKHDREFWNSYQSDKLCSIGDVPCSFQPVVNDKVPVIPFFSSFLVLKIKI